MQLAPHGLVSWIGGPRPAVERKRHPGGCSLSSKMAFTPPPKRQPTRPPPRSSASLISAGRLPAERGSSGRTSSGVLPTETETSAREHVSGDQVRCIDSG